MRSLQKRAVTVATNGFFSTGGTLSLDTGGSLTGGPVFANSYQLNDGTASADLSGPGGLTKDTGGTVTLSGVNSYAGGTVVDAGTLIVANAGALPDGSSLTVGSRAAFAFGVGQAAASSSTAVPITATVAAGAPAGASVTASAISTLSPVLRRQVENLSYVPATLSTPAETLVDFAASVSAAKDAPAAAAPVAMSGTTIDAVFASHQSALDPTVAPAGNAQSAGAWAWLAAIESAWNSSDQNKMTDSTVAALGKVLARFGL
jgi:autotransporter-associated beta strand protein